ncbi:MAG: hypothetical protein AAF191_04520, partial [Verrucomicrobiota bacterium]
GREVNPSCRTWSVDLSRDELAVRLSLLLINESFRCLEEGIVDQPDNLDLAKIFGTGFAPFRGGPIAYAHSLGLKRVHDCLSQLADAEGERFLPSPQLTSNL